MVTRALIAAVLKQMCLMFILFLACYGSRRENFQHSSVLEIKGKEVVLTLIL